MRVIRIIGAASAAALLALCRAGAAPPPVIAPATDATQLDSQLNSGFLGSLQRTNFLLGDLFGLRTTLAKYGISLAIQETSEILGNATGGVHRGAAYDGLTQAILQLDTQRAFGWYGGLVNISALQIHGRNLSTDNLQSLQTASGIEADRATRLWEAWYDQKFLDEDRADIKIGQQSVDQDFIVSTNGAAFVNTMFGWPLVPSVDLPGGGPAYPLSALGLRLRWRPTDAVTLLGGVFGGSPAPTAAGDPQRSNASGTSFPTNRGTLLIAEIQYAYPALGGMAYPGEGAPLGHTYRLGVWYDTERFDGQDPAIPTRHRGDYSIYAVADQMVWRAPGNPNRSVSIFGRVMGAPQTDRNLADFSANGGVVYHQPIINRSADTVALGLGYAHINNGSETFLEASYQYQVHPWWQLQPDVQYVFTPGGTTQIRNEFVLGLRTSVLF